MYCKHCGKELNQDARFCPACGAEQNTYDDPFTSTEVNEVVEPKPARVWSIFSKIGRIMGIVAIATSWIPYLIGLTIGIAGIVFSCLGRKAKTDIAEDNYRLGLKLSIAGIVVSVVSFIIFIVIYAVVLGVAISQSGY